MKVVVTGSAGFIGSHIAEALLMRGDKVIGIDDLNNYYNPSQKIENNKILKNYDNYTFHKQDITDYDGLKAIFESEKPDKVVHLAARAGVRASISEPLLYTKVNVLGSLNLLNLASEHHIRSFVLTSSSSVYGDNKKIPFSETDRTDSQVSPYAATKKASENLAYAHHRITKLPIIVIRPFTVYGPRGRPDMAPFIFMTKILHDQPIEQFGDGSTSRDYTYISDIVAGYLAALDFEHSGFERVNLGNSHPITLKDFIATVEKVVGKKAQIIEKPIPKGDVEKTYADISKAKRLFGYDPSTTLEQGLRIFFQWLK